MLRVRGPVPWAARDRPCRYCTIPTHLRDLDGQPAHLPCTAKQQGAP